MNGIVRLALSRPYTFIVLAIMILIFGVLSVLKSATDIFPTIRIPVIAAVWSYNGLSPDEMAGRVVYSFERALPNTVSGIEHIESQSLPGVSVVKIFFQPDVNIQLSMAQTVAIAQTVVKSMPAGATAPQILSYNASSVPILQLVLSGLGMSEQQLYDVGNNTLRPFLISVPGSAFPGPYGGKIRQIQIDLDPVALQSKGLSAEDVGAALAAQQQITPSGTAKVGGFEYVVKLNNSPNAIAELNDLPIKQVGGATIYMRDIGYVRDGSSPQTNVVRKEGRRTVLMSVNKNGSASTLAIVDGVKTRLPQIKDSLPANLKIDLLNDQSIFVKAAVSGVIKEGVIAAALTSVMILLFLGSWRSTVIIATSIPLSVLASIAALYAMGQTLNLMTLGGLALAVGILVDDATVTIENINWHLEQGKDVKTAILDGARQIVTPAFVSLLCICIVFVPMFVLPGIAGYLFIPMAEAVVFAMIASFVLSRTLVPTMAMFLLRPHQGGHAAGAEVSSNPLVRFQRAFETGFGRVRAGYSNILALALERRRMFLPAFLGCVVLSFGLAPFLGSNFFPTVDSGAMALHVRAPTGTQLEDTAAHFDRVEQAIRQIIPTDEVQSIVDNIGIPTSSINLAYSNTGTIGPEDGDIYITLSKHHRPTADYVRQLREKLPQLFPSSSFSFLPADIVSQILNFGSPAPLDIQITGQKREADAAYANEVLRRVKAIPGVADARVQQANNYPQFNVAVDRSLASTLGVTERNVTTTLTTTLSGSQQQAPAFWLSPNGVSYSIVLQTPQRDINSLAALQSIPVSSSTPGQVQMLGGLATIKRTVGPAVVSHYGIEPSLDVYASVQDRDLGGVAKAVRQVIKDTEKDVPKGSEVTLRGQVDTMDTAFSGLFFGLLGAVVLIYLLIVVNFQSWTDPFVIITALPAALAGIVWILFATGTPLSVPALTGAIMCMGVATANSILVVSFARERLAATGDATLAALEAGVTRFRPVIMTALAMVIGMTPMALGLGEGAEQNAPLGRAVIGGLVFATVATLVFVPAVFALVHGRRAPKPTGDAAELGEAYA